jgi:hypothetical protein
MCPDEAVKIANGRALASPAAAPVYAKVGIAAPASKIAQMTGKGKFCRQVIVPSL